MLGLLFENQPPGRLGIMIPLGCPVLLLVLAVLLGISIWMALQTVFCMYALLFVSISSSMEYHFFYFVVTIYSLSSCHRVTAHSTSCHLFISFIGLSTMWGLLWMNLTIPCHCNSAIYLTRIGLRSLASIVHASSALKANINWTSSVFCTISLQFSSSVWFHFCWPFTTEYKLLHQRWYVISYFFHHCLCCNHTLFED